MAPEETVGPDGPVESTGAVEPEESDDADGAAGPEEPAASTGRARLVGLVGLVAMLLVALVGWWGPWRDEPDEPDNERAAVASTTSASTTTTSILTAEGPVAPLTGLGVFEGGVANLARPALVAKVDAAPKAMPQTGLESADIVIEIRVEGISRYMGVWHSQDVAEIGPIRSARTSDPDLLAAFGRPIFAYSGGNRGVLNDLERVDWMVDQSELRVPGAYRRSTDRSMPHNLYLDPGLLWGRVEGSAVPPQPVFTYRAVGSPPPGDAAPGFTVSVGSDAAFVWDGFLNGWRRWVHDRPHLAAAGQPLAPTNVVVLDTGYVPSPADRQSPEAISTGSGRAWVFSQGTVESGVWTREARSDPWSLTALDGTAMELQPGTTWVVLAQGGPQLMSPESAAALLNA